MVFRLLVSTPNDSSHPYKLFVFYFAYKQTNISIPQFHKIQFSTKFEFKFLKCDFLDNLFDNVDLLKRYNRTVTMSSSLSNDDDLSQELNSLAETEKNESPRKKASQIFHNFFFVQSIEHFDSK